MSEQTKTGVVATRNGLVPGSPRHKVTLRVVALFGGVVLILALLAGIVLWVWHVETEKKAVHLTTYEQADKTLNNGNYAAAQEVLAAELPNAKTPQAKASIYSLQATLAINAKQYNDAAKYAQQAENLVHTSATAHVLARVAELRGDNAAAREYLQLAIDRLANGVPKDSPQYSLMTRNLQNELQELGK